jgi:hypothetical protein
MEGQQADSIVVVGVLPPGFRYANRDRWLPLNRFWGAIDADRGNHWFSGVGRLKPGVTLERARADLDSISRDLEQQYPATNKDVRAVPESLVGFYAGNTVQRFAYLGSLNLGRNDDWIQHRNTAREHPGSDSRSYNRGRGRIQ